MREATTPPSGDSSLMPLLILALIGLGLYLFFRKGARQRRAAFFVRHAALFVYLGRDMLAIGRSIVTPFRVRRTKGPTDEDLEKLLNDPGLPEPPAAQRASGNKPMIPCVFCGKMIRNGGLYCDECRD